MQRNEIIIEQFIKTIKGSASNVEGDPVLLNKVFEALDKKRKRRKFMGVFMFVSLALVGAVLIIWGTYGNKIMPEPTNGMMVVTGHQSITVPEYGVPVDIKENAVKNDIQKKSEYRQTKKTDNTTSKKQDNGFKNVVTYKFNDHQVDVFKNGEQEFIQINVFGADGVEQDVLKIMEDLKKSYRKNEVYVDSVKHK